ncbi:hypothetical protein PAE9249_00441 [Paenibacillus sp. CECT 9249]|nr:hypothetical protein PAE9249_00441 [Paenibacillus sp. CECT 9249]
MQHLRVLGFTEMESRMLVVLAEQGAMTGYEVAKRLGVSRSNVYAALQKLVDHGFVMCSKGEPSLYTMIPVEELTRSIADKMQESIRIVEESMPKRSDDRTEFYSIESDRKVMDNLRRELEKAQFEIIADVWTEEASLFRKELETAEERGVKVLWSVIGGDEDLRLAQQMIVHGRDGAWRTQTGGRKFSFVIDRRWCMIGMRGEGQATKAMATEHPAMIELLLNNFAHDLVIYEMEQEMGPEIERKYGANYERIYQKYFKLQ